MGNAWATPVDFTEPSTNSAMFFLKPGGGSADKANSLGADPGQSSWLVNPYSLLVQNPEALQRRGGI